MFLYIVCDLRFWQLSPHNTHMLTHIITLSKYMTDQTVYWLTVAPHFAGEEQGGTPDKLTGFWFGTITLSLLYFVPSV